MNYANYALTAFIALFILSQSVLAGTLIVPNDYPSLQSAIDAANDGDTIQLTADVEEHSVTIEKDLTLRGGPTRPTISAAGHGCLEIYRSTVSVESIGLYDTEVAVYARDASLTLTNVHIDRASPGFGSGRSSSCELTWTGTGFGSPTPSGLPRSASWRPSRRAGSTSPASWVVLLTPTSEACRLSG